MLREALGFPRNREGATRDLIIGGALVLASPVLLPGLLLEGYLLRVMNAGARGRGVPPAFGDWGRLLVDGFKAVVVAVVWGLLPLVVLAVGTVATAVFVLSLQGPPLSPSIDPTAATMEHVAIVGIVVFALLVLAVVSWLHLPAALVALATQRRLGAAFQTGALWSVVSTKQYLVGCILAAVVLLIGSILAAAFTPVLVGFVLLFYVQVTVAYIVGRSVGGAAVTAIRPLS